MNTRLIDDLNNEIEAHETVEFGLDGRDYEIDLSTKHATELRDAFAKYVDAARRTSRHSKTARPGRKHGGPATVDREQNQPSRPEGHFRYQGTDTPTSP